MSDKGEEGFKFKLGRKLSKRSSARTPETPKPKPDHGSKSATLPTNMDAGAAMAAHQGSGSGIFSKLKRRFRLGSSKGKYDLKTSASPGKPRWLRRKSDESQLRRSKESIEDETEKATTSSRKPSSAKTMRKTKTDKEEVILIRKDKRVSVICKAENGNAEVLFSNIENSDEDSSSAWGGNEEDPYATLTSVRDEIDQRDTEPSKTNSSSKSSLSSREKLASPRKRSSTTTSAAPSKTPDSIEEYPYARIDPSKKKIRNQEQQQVPLKAKDFNLQVRARIRSQTDPDYETLEEVQHRKSDLVSSPTGACHSPNNNVTLNSSSLGDDTNTSQNSLDDLDPDYESLEEIQHKQRALSLHLPPRNLPPCEESLDSSAAFDPYASLTRPKSYAASTTVRPAKSPSSVSSLDQLRHSQEGKIAPTGQSSRHSSASASSTSLAPLAPLAAGVDTSLPSDPGEQQAQTGMESLEIEEECLYDNPNVILRKQQQQSSLRLSTSSIGGSGTSPSHGLGLGDLLTTPTHHHHHHHIKTPAEEELVEKLSSLLAPPLPLRNYQKEEVYQTPSGARSKIMERCGSGKSTNSSARHSWSSQSSRHTMSEFLDVASAGTGSSVSPRSQQRWKRRSAQADGRRHSTHLARDSTWGGGEASPGSKSKTSKKGSSRESLDSEKGSCHSQDSERISQDSERIFFTCGEITKGSNDVSEASHVISGSVTNKLAPCEQDTINSGPGEMEKAASLCENGCTAKEELVQSGTAYSNLTETGDDCTTIWETSQESTSETFLKTEDTKGDSALLDNEGKENGNEICLTSSFADLEIIESFEGPKSCSEKEEETDMDSDQKGESRVGTDSAEYSKELVNGKTSEAEFDFQQMETSPRISAISLDPSESAHFNSVEGQPSMLQEFCRGLASQLVDEAVKQGLIAPKEDVLNQPSATNNSQIALNNVDNTSPVNHAGLGAMYSDELFGKVITGQEFNGNGYLESHQNWQGEERVGASPFHHAAQLEASLGATSDKEPSCLKPTQLKLNTVPSSVAEGDHSPRSKSDGDASATATPSEACGILASCPDCSKDGENFNPDQSFGTIGPTIMRTGSSEVRMGSNGVPVFTFKRGGARPKVVPLPIPAQDRLTSSPERGEYSSGGDEQMTTHRCQELERILRGEAQPLRRDWQSDDGNIGVEQMTTQRCQELDRFLMGEAQPFGRDWQSDDDDIGVWEDTLSPSVPDMDFCDFLGEREDILSLMSLGAGTNDQGRLVAVRKRNRLRMEPELRVQETIYVDSDSETEEEYVEGKGRVCQASRDGTTEVHKSFVIKVQRDFSITKVVRPLVYANPRLLENVISGKFKFDPSLDKDYLCSGLFKRGRFFSYLTNSNKLLVDRKLKAYFNAKRQEFTPARNPTYEQLQQMQQRADELQVKIDRKLEEVKDLPTFHDVRMHLLKTQKIDSWEPERANSRKYPNTDDGGVTRRSNGEESDSASTKPSTATSTPENNQLPGACSSADAGIPLGCIETNGGYSYVPSRRPQPCNDFQFENTIFLEDQREEEFFSPGQSPQPCPSPANSMESVLDDFSKLCNPNLPCKRCGDGEESDSEDEVAALDVYVRTVGPRFSRALHGELAYTAHMRAQRPGSQTGGAGLSSATACAVGACQGGQCHLSWQDWSSMDLHFRKLVPHSSPRLDFQFLLKTYAELKHFVLKDRARNVAHKGCYVKTFAWQSHYSDQHRQSQASEPVPAPRCSRAEEFVFLKLLRDELCHFGNMIEVSPGARALFVEERDIGHSCLYLLRTILRIIHRMKHRIKLAEVQSPDGSVLTHQDLSSIEDHRQFHVSNFLRFRADSMLDSLRTWMTPEDYAPDPNILVTGRTVVAHTDSRSLELAGMLGVAEPQPLQEGEDFVESMQQLQSKEWYWGPISYEEAAMILQDKEDGSFLVRDSSDHKYLLSLSFKSLGEIHHTRMEHAKGLFSFWSQPESHGKARICEFIDKSVQNSRDGRFLYFLRPSARGVPPLPIRLLNPVSRNFRVASLKHLSRFVVRQNVRKDHLNRLPVPEKVKRYLKEKQYYAEIPDDDQWPFGGESAKL